MPRPSAGLLVHRVGATAGLQVLLVHPGGPFWARRDEGAWSIPKGEYVDGEDPLRAARREFTEELGTDPPEGELLPLGELRQPSGKRVVAWAVRGDVDTTRSTSNTVEMEWPRGSGRTITFPEVDRAEWFDLVTARKKLLVGQRQFLDALLERLSGDTGSS